MVKLHIQATSFMVSLLLFLSTSSCQKKEVLQAEDPVPQDSQKVESCPGCEFPDSIWPQNNSANQLVFRLHFDSSLARLNSSGGPSVLLPGHSAQSPTMVALALEQIELMPEAGTLPGQGVLLYAAPQNSCGGTAATSYCKLHLIGDSEIVCSVNLNLLPPGNYKWLRLSVAYSELNVISRNTSSGNTLSTFAGFYAEKTYLTKLKTETSVMTPSLGGIGIKPKGYFMFEQLVFNQSVKLDGLSAMQTVVNGNSQQPDTRFMYAEFADLNGLNPKPLLVTGNETTGHEIKLYFGTNKSFEWTELTADGLFQPELGEKVYDFGFRNLQARH